MQLGKTKGKHDVIEEKLDHGLTTSKWFDLFSNFKQVNGITTKSYHSPILIKLDLKKSRPLHRPFHFGNSWLLEPKLNDVVKSGWDKASQDYSYLKFIFVLMG